MELIPIVCQFMNNDDDEQLGAQIVQCFDDDIQPIVVAAAAVVSTCTVPRDCMVPFKVSSAKLYQRIHLTLSSHISG